MKITIEHDNAAETYVVNNFEEISKILREISDGEVDESRVEFENNLNSFDSAFETLDANWQVVKENFGDAHKEADKHFEKMISEYNKFLWSISDDEDD